jgi:hypothetical protein
MTVQAMRTAIKKQYASTKWNQRVDRMKDAQVTAVYLRLKYQTNGKL